MAELQDYRTLTAEQEQELIRVLSNPSVVQYLSNRIWDELQASRDALLDNTESGVVRRARTVGVLDAYQSLLMTIQENKDDN